MERNNLFEDKYLVASNKKFIMSLLKSKFIKSAYLVIVEYNISNLKK